MRPSSDRVYRKQKRQIKPFRLYHEASIFLKQIMVSARVSWEGKKQTITFYTDRPKVNNENYIQLLDDNLLPGCKRLYPRNNYVYHQNGASSHTRRVAQAHLEEATHDSLKMNGLHKVQNVTKWMTEHGTL